MLDQTAVLRVSQEIESLLQLWQRRGERPLLGRVFQPGKASTWKQRVQVSIVKALRNEARRQAVTIEGIDCRPASAEKVFQRRIDLDRHWPGAGGAPPPGRKLRDLPFRERYGEVYRIMSKGEMKWLVYCYEIFYSCNLKSFPYRHLALHGAEFRLFSDLDTLLAEALPVFGDEILNCVEQGAAEGPGAGEAEQELPRPSDPLEAMTLAQRSPDSELVASNVGDRRQRPFAASATERILRRRKGEPTPHTSGEPPARVLRRNASPENAASLRRHAAAAPVEPVAARSDSRPADPPAGFGHRIAGVFANLAALFFLIGALLLGLAPDGPRDHYGALPARPEIDLGSAPPAAVLEAAVPKVTTTTGDDKVAIAETSETTAEDKAAEEPAVERAGATARETGEERLETRFVASVKAPPVIPVNPTTKARGAAGRDLVREIQGLLDRIGLSPGPLDGQIGPATRASIVAYQSKHGLLADGQATEDLLAHLREEVARNGQRVARQVAAERPQKPDIASQVTVAARSSARPAAGEEGVTLQLSALKTVDDAIRMKTLLQKEFAHLFADLTLEVQTIAYDNTEPLYRIYTAGQLNRSNARDICAQLQLQKRTCVVVKN
ncbi:MAG: peptidoglycan-binding protein [Rhodospirillales bacterium]|nr:peptidoglycan-binding protein [Rhodospirillales bacterium]